ncbi:MAG: septum formation protein Maf [Candidatus Omnitrophica bacterium]|nr:septum formation protein Maf [Candidatus Omnitrophota bacterium]MBU4479046.1 septum formation protein Maf [Candidatus Omnitrophota bacterium]MCG2703466.1 Maf family protein [Candidatus Omnitrophota bacterium]
MEKEIILASRSPRRKELLKNTGLRFKVIPSSIDEIAASCLAPEHHAIHLALSKAEEVAKRHGRGIIIAADTIVVFHNKIFGKPRDIAHAEKMLASLSGTTHYVYTAIAVIDAKTGKRIVDIDKTKITTRKIPVSQIKVLALRNHDKAGGYAVQENADILVKKMQGDYYNVVGLPLSKLKKVLALFSVEIKDT